MYLNLRAVLARVLNGRTTAYLALAGAVSVVLAGPAGACGLNSDCVVGDRVYRLYVPEGIVTAAPIGVLIFAHGYRGTAASQMGDAALRGLAADLGMALVTLGAAGRDWNLAHRPSEPDQSEAREYDYVDAVLTDLDARLPRDPARTVMSGFSAGAMLTWTLACGMPDRFAGFVPMSGTFWSAPPDICRTPAASVVHIHGTEDGTVPLAGRAIGPTAQGNVPETLAMYRTFGGYDDAGRIAAPGGMTCDTAANAAGRVLDFCTFRGGHSFSAERLGWGIRTVLGDR
jgi:polyhydroxybutyrate depolymerase